MIKLHKQKILCNTTRNKVFDTIINWNLYLFKRPLKSFETIIKHEFFSSQSSEYFIITVIFGGVLPFESLFSFSFWFNFFAHH